MTKHYLKYRHYFSCCVIIALWSGGLSMAQDSLKEYRAKRKVGQSGEPAGTCPGLQARQVMSGRPTGKKQHKNKKPIFTIQKHNASHLHYDFRLEIDGVMPSWAVPKGPSLDPKIKRLAIMTEDHPLDYATFEGVIPEGNYGAGEVIVWDTGTYDNIKHDHEGNVIDMAKCMELGTVEIFLHGKKLQGAFALIRTHFGADNNWLLIKMRDEYANVRRNPVKSQPESVLSGKTIEDLQEKKDKGVKKVTKKKTQK